MKSFNFAIFLTISTLSSNVFAATNANTTEVVSGTTYQTAPVYDDPAIDENVDDIQAEENVETSDDFTLDEDIDESQQKEEVIEDDQIDETRKDMYRKDNDKTYNEEQSDDSRGQD